MSAVRFLLNGELRSEESAPPTMTVLDWLRIRAGLTGTKEGCAEGDCGACTVVLARQRAGELRYEAVNSCLTVLPQLHGCSVFTIEGLSTPDGALHPVQQALIDADATQCGFCTPGIGMSMFAFEKDGEPADDVRIHEALAGNLCRCTGYRSIIDAFRQAIVAGRDDDNGGRPCAGGETQLPVDSAEYEYRHRDQSFFAPRSLQRLLELRARLPDAVLLGGGTDLGLRVSKAREAFATVISTAFVPELNAVQETAHGLEIGGAVTYTQALPLADRHFPAFAALIRRIGSRQIRNLGTIAGNLVTASPIGDTLPCLVALDASVSLLSQRGERRVPVGAFITGYRQTQLAADEVVRSIRIPYLASEDAFAAYKLSKRFDQDISTVVAAFRLRLCDGNVESIGAVFGGMAAQVKRARALESALCGRAWTPRSLEDVDALLGHDFSPLSDHRGGAAYRLRAAAGLVRRFQIETASADIPTRVESL